MAFMVLQLEEWGVGSFLTVHVQTIRAASANASHQLCLCRTHLTHPCIQVVDAVVSVAANYLLDGLVADIRDYIFDVRVSVLITTAYTHHRNVKLQDAQLRHFKIKIA